LLVRMENQNENIEKRKIYHLPYDCHTHVISDLWV
jgi:hypothetical protein